MSDELKKLAQEEAEKEKNYKSSHDAERVYYIIHALSLMKDYPYTTALAASLTRELRAMNLRQADLDAKDAAERMKKTAEAQTAAAKSASEEESSENPPRPHAPSARRT